MASGIAKLKNRASVSSAAANEFTYGFKCTACLKFDLVLLSSKLIMCGSCNTIHNIENIFTDYFDMLNVLNITQPYSKKEIKKHINVPLSNYALLKYITKLFWKTSTYSQQYYYKS